MHSPLPLNLEIIRETIQELYEPCLKQIGRLEFYKPYPEAIERENPYQGLMEFLDSLYSLEKMDNPLWSMWLGS